MQAFKTSRGEEYYRVGSACPSVTGACPTMPGACPTIPPGLHASADVLSCCRRADVVEDARGVHRLVPPERIIREASVDLPGTVQHQPKMRIMNVQEKRLCPALPQLPCLPTPCRRGRRAGGEKPAVATLEAQAPLAPMPVAAEPQLHQRPPERLGVRFNNLWVGVAAVLLALVLAGMGLVLILDKGQHTFQALVPRRTPLDSVRFKDLLHFRHGQNLKQAPIAALAVASAPEAAPVWGGPAASSARPAGSFEQSPRPDLFSAGPPDGSIAATSEGAAPVAAEGRLRVLRGRR